MEITKAELLDIYLGLNSLGDLQGAKFAYAVMRNINILKDEAEALLSAKDPKADYIEFERKQVALARSHAIVKDGAPQTYEENGKKFFAIEDQKKFTEEFEKLKEEHKEAIENYQKQLKDLEDILKEKVDITFYKINKDQVPENITVKQYASIELIIEDKEN